MAKLRLGSGGNPGNAGNDGKEGKLGNVGKPGSAKLSAGKGGKAQRLTLHRGFRRLGDSRCLRGCRRRDDGRDRVADRCYEGSK